MNLLSSSLPGVPSSEGARPLKEEEEKNILILIKLYLGMILYKDLHSNQILYIFICHMQLSLDSHRSSQIELCTAPQKKKHLSSVCCREGDLWR